MCPGCFAGASLFAASATSAGGLTTFAMKTLHGRTTTQTGGDQDGGPQPDRIGRAWLAHDETHARHATEEE
jgi:hypothetical protein